MYVKESLRSLVSSFSDFQECYEQRSNSVSIA